MDRNTVQEQGLVERYLQNKLPEDEKAAFEEFFLTDPETLAELELTEKLQAGMRSLAESGELPAERNKPSGLKAFLTSPQYAAAASILMVFAFGLSGVLYQQLQDRPDSVAPPMGATLMFPISDLTVRSGGADTRPTLSLAAGSQAFVVFSIDPGPEEYAGYRATISRADGVNLPPVTDLVAGYDGMLSVSVAAALLSPGDYELRLEGQQMVGGEYLPISRTPFRVSD